MTRIGALVLGLVVGCNGLEETTIEHGRHIDLEIDPGLEPCGDLVGHMDRFLELAAGAWNVDLDGRRYSYHWYAEANYLTESGCLSGSSGCASSGAVRAVTVPLDRELVHVVTSAIGHTRSFFTEGAAVAFELPGNLQGTGLPGDGSIDADLLAASSIPGTRYMLAGAFTRFLVDRFGMPAYLEFYADLENDDDHDTIASVHEAAFGESFAETVARFDEERRDCEHERFRFKLYECAAPPISWEGDTATMRRELSCADEDVVGPFFLAGKASTWARVTIEDAGLFELSVAADGLSARITLGSCGGCESISPVSISATSSPRRLFLDPGDYYLRLDGSVATDTFVSLRLRRIDE